MPSTDTFNIDDLIPKELRQAVNSKKENTDKTNTVEDNYLDDVNSYGDAEDDDSDDDLENILGRENLDDNDSDDDTDEDENDDDDNAEPDPFAPRMSEDQDEEEELSFDDDSIDALIAGDPDAVVKKKPTQEEGTFPWHENKKYQKLLEKASYAGLSQKQFDTLIQEASDTKVLDNTTYTNSLKTKVEQLENDKDVSKAEIDRLRAIEKAVYFDNSEHIQNKYGAPMTNEIEGMKSVLEYEGLDISLRDLTIAKDRTTFNNLLSGYELEDESKIKLLNHWKNYRNLSTEYATDKEAAKKDLSKHLATSVSDDVLFKIARNTLNDFMKSHEQFAYIAQGISEGLDKHPDVQEVISRGKDNFFNIMKAVSNPHDVIHNDKYLGSLARFMLDASHNKLYAKKYTEQTEHVGRLEKNLKKMIESYRELAKSAKGITGDRRGGFGTPKSKKDVKESQKDLVTEFNSILSGDINIDDILA